jgi:hypothetical protein
MVFDHGGVEGLGISANRCRRSGMVAVAPHLRLLCPARTWRDGSGCFWLLMGVDK